MFIKDGKRINLNVPQIIDGVTYQDLRRFPEVMVAHGLTEIADPVDPEDYSNLTHYRQEIDGAPYMVYTLKPQQQIVQALNAQAQSARTAAYLSETDPLFFKEQRGEVPAGTWLAAVQAVKDAHPKYPEVVDVETIDGSGTR